MGSSYVSLHYHIVFSTKNRLRLIHSRWRSRLHEYLGGTACGLGGDPRSIGGTDDHVHLLVSLESTHDIASFLRELKKASSVWANGNHCRDFAWQEGYAAFTVSASLVDRVRRYVESQESHHGKQTFIQELQSLLDKHGVEYDPKYLK
jgi:REP element-mobilizing transposase RayT